MDMANWLLAHSDDAEEAQGAGVTVLVHGHASLPG